MIASKSEDRGHKVLSLCTAHWPWERVTHLFWDIVYRFCTGSCSMHLSPQVILSKVRPQTAPFSAPVATRSWDRPAVWVTPSPEGRMNVRASFSDEFKRTLFSTKLASSHLLQVETSAVDWSRFQLQLKPCVSTSDMAARTCPFGPLAM